MRWLKRLLVVLLLLLIIYLAGPNPATPKYDKSMPVLPVTDSTKEGQIRRTVVGAGIAEHGGVQTVQRCASQNEIGGLDTSSNRRHGVWVALCRGPLAQSQQEQAQQEE